MIYAHDMQVLRHIDPDVFRRSQSEDLPPKAVGLVMEWAKQHKNELLKEWDLAREKQSLFQIEPLE